MKGPTHELFGTAAAVVIADQLNLPLEAATALAVAAFATSRLPDRLEGPFLAHRTVTHYALVGLFFVCLTYLGVGAIAGPTWGLVLAGGVALGYLGHIAADSCTPHGTYALAPFWPRKVWLLPYSLRIRTGSIRENILAFLVTAGLLAYAWLLIIPHA